MRRLRRDEAGFTLVEMLVSCVLSVIVLGAVMGLVLTAQRSTTRTTQRTDAAQRGRLAMEQIVQGLRSQVCLQPDADSQASTITAGSKTSVTFYAGMAVPDPATGLPQPFKPQRVTYALTTLADGTQAITQTSVAGAYNALSGLWQFTAAPSARRVVDGVTAPSDGTVFRYFAYNADGTLDEAHPLDPLTDDDLPHVAQIEVSFVAKPTGKDALADPRVQAAFDDRVTLRLLFPAPKTAVQNRTAACVI